jgi:hypothetical protein
MRNGQNKRMRGRNRKGGHHQNPLSRVYESNGQDVKIRGTASHIAEKYLQLARDAQSSGDMIAAEHYYQHAEHYFRLIATAQEQLRQTPSYFQQQPGDMRGNMSDDGYDDGDNDQPPMAGEPFAPREQQSFYPREQQHHQPQQFQPQQYQPQQNGQGGQGAQGVNGPNGNGYDGSPDRFPLHRRRRRHRSGGPRDNAPDHAASGDNDAPSSGPQSDE